MSRENIYYGNFTEIENRLKKELNLKRTSQLINLIEVPQPTYSNRKKRGEFAAEWIVKLSMKFNFSVEWILTGEGPTRIHLEKISRKNNFISKIEEWIEEATQDDPRKEVWFELQFENLFPEFKDWMQRKNAAVQCRRMAEAVA